MSIKVTILEVRQAYRALRRINEEARLLWESAWETSKVLNKQRPLVLNFEETQAKLFRDAGAVPADGGLKLEDPVRGEDEPGEDFSARMAEYREKARALDEAIREMNALVVEVDCAPLPLRYFKDEGNVKPEKRKLYSGNDLADAAPFLEKE